MIGAFAVQIIAGYIVGRLIGVEKRRRVAFIGALAASFLVAYPGFSNSDGLYTSFITWPFAATFFWWRIGRAPQKQDAPPAASS